MDYSFEVQKVSLGVDGRILVLDGEDRDRDTDQRYRRSKEGDGSSETRLMMEQKCRREREREEDETRLENAQWQNIVGSEHEFDYQVLKQSFIELWRDLQAELKRGFEYIKPHLQTCSNAILKQARDIKWKDGAKQAEKWFRSLTLRLHGNKWLNDWQRQRNRQLWTRRSAFITAALFCCFLYVFSTAGDERIETRVVELTDETKLQPSEIPDWQQTQSASYESDRGLSLKAVERQSPHWTQVDGSQGQAHTPNTNSLFFSDANSEQHLLQSHLQQLRGSRTFYRFALDRRRGVGSRSGLDIDSDSVSLLQPPLCSIGSCEEVEA